MEGEGFGVVEAGPSEQNCVSLIYKRESTGEEGKEEGRGEKGGKRKQEERKKRKSDATPRAASRGLAISSVVDTLGPR